MADSGHTRNNEYGRYRYGLSNETSYRLGFFRCLSESLPFALAQCRDPHAN
jgi:hypothetical protein